MIPAPFATWQHPYESRNCQIGIKMRDVWCKMMGINMSFFPGFWMRAHQHVYTFKEKIIPEGTFKNRMVAEIVRKIKTQQNRNKAKEYKIQHK